MEIQTITQPDIRVAAVRHVGAYTEISEAFERLSQIAQRSELFVPGALMLGLYHDDPQQTPENELRSDAAISLADGTDAPEGAKEMTVPGGKYGMLSYRGPYDGLPNAWKELMDGMVARGDEMGSGMSYELYRNDPTDTAPEDLITEIYSPIG